MNKIYKLRKKILLIVLCTFLTAYQTAWAQVGSYTFASTSGTYTPITGGTVVVATTTTPAADDEEYFGLPIGFSFTYNGVSYTDFGIGANGYISFGVFGDEGAVAGLTFDLRQIPSLGEIRYQTTGTTPNRICTIQFANWTNTISPTDVYNFQIKIRETTNTISAVYGSISASASSGGMIVGLLGVQPDFATRTVTNATTNNWANSTLSVGTTLGLDALLSNTVFPANGLTYTWSPLVCTAVPAISTTISDALVACPGIPFALSLSASNAGNIYQWQSSSTLGGTYTSIIGANGATYSASQTVSTAYRCIISCIAASTSVTSAPTFVTMGASNTCYCVATVPNNDDTDIGNVTFGTLNNGTATPVLNNTTAVGTYSNFTGLAPVSFARNGVYLFSMSQITSAGLFYQAVTNVFIDYNQNGIFDANERVLTTGQTSQAVNTVTGSISIPTTALLGNTRMRVILLEGGTNATPACSPLGGFGYGEIEDYTINITVANTSCVVPVFTNTVATAATIGTPYSLNAGATVTSGAVLSYGVSPALPSGLSLNATTGLISGTPTGTATPLTTYTVSAFQLGCSATTQTYAFAVIAVVVTCPTVTFTNTTAPNGVISVPYSFNAGATVASGPAISYSILPALPAGLSLNPTTGVISGTPLSTTASNIYNVIANRTGCLFIVQPFTFAINAVPACPIITFTNTIAPNATTGISYNFNAGATVASGVALSYSISPALPSGLSLDATTGAISGISTTITSSNTYTVVAGQTGCPSATRTYTFAVVANASCIALVFANLVAPNAYIGSSYNFSTNVVAVAGSTVTYSVSPSLPAGLSLNATNGLISGTPSTTIPIISTNYVVLATQAGCPPYARAYPIAVGASLTTSIDLSLSNQVKVSPNPSNGDFNIDFSGLNVGKSVARVYDIQGKQIFLSEINTNSTTPTTISLDKFANGIYLLEIETSKGRILKRLIKAN